MKWLKDNPFLTGLIAATLVGLGALAFLLYQALGRYQETFDGYTQAVQKLHTLQGLSPFPSKENLEKSRVLASDYQMGVNNLRSHLAAMALPLDHTITAQKFQDNLRTAVNETVDKANQAGVALPKDFYLGFGPYATSLPSEQAAPFLARQLTLIKQMVQQFIELKITSLDQLDRKPIPQELAAATPNPPLAELPGNKKRAPAIPADLFDRLPMDLAFTAEQSKFRVAFNSLLDHSQFLIVRALQVQNSNPVPPPVIFTPPPDQTQPVSGTPAVPGIAGAPVISNPAGVGAPGNSVGSSPSGAAPSNDLNVILGRELVKATMRIEIMDFSAPEPETKPETKPVKK